MKRHLPPRSRYLQLAAFTWAHMDSTIACSLERTLSHHASRFLSVPLLPADAGCAKVSSRGHYNSKQPWLSEHSLSHRAPHLFWCDSFLQMLAAFYAFYALGFIFRNRGPCVHVSSHGHCQSTQPWLNEVTLSHRAPHLLSSASYF